MRNRIANLSRRCFLGSATLLGLASTLLRGKAVQGMSPEAKKPRVGKDSFGTRGILSSREDSPRIVWTSTTCHGGKAPCLNADGHPTFDNPHRWTTDQMDDIYRRFLHPQAMAFNIKWMGLASYLKEGTYETVRNRLENQTTANKRAPEL